MEPKEDFTFVEPFRRVDWRAVQGADLRRLEEARTAQKAQRLLGKTLGSVLYGALDNEEADTLCQDRRLYQAFQVAQYSAQYLSHCQDILARKTRGIQDNVDYGLAELEDMHQRFTERKKQKRLLKRELGKLDDLISQYDTTLKVLRPDLADRLVVQNDGSVAVRVKPQPFPLTEEEQISQNEKSQQQEQELRQSWRMMKEMECRLSNFRKEAAEASSLREKLARAEAELARLQKDANASDSIQNPTKLPLHTSRLSINSEGLQHIDRILPRHNSDTDSDNEDTVRISLDDEAFAREKALAELNEVDETAVLSHRGTRGLAHHRSRLSLDSEESSFAEQKEFTIMSEGHEGESLSLFDSLDGSLNFNEGKQADIVRHETTMSEDRQNSRGDLFSNQDSDLSIASFSSNYARGSPHGIDPQTKASYHPSSMLESSDDEEAYLKSHEIRRDILKELQADQRSEVVSETQDADNSRNQVEQSFQDVVDDSVLHSNHSFMSSFVSEGTEVNQWEATVGDRDLLNLDIDHHDKGSTSYAEVEQCSIASPSNQSWRDDSLDIYENDEGRIELKENLHKGGGLNSQSELSFDQSMDESNVINDEEMKHDVFRDDRMEGKSEDSQELIQAKDQTFDTEHIDIGFEESKNKFHDKDLGEYKSEGDDHQSNGNFSEDEEHEEAWNAEITSTSSYRVGESSMHNPKDEGSLASDQGDRVVDRDGQHVFEDEEDEKYENEISKISEYSFLQESGGINNELSDLSGEGFGHDKSYEEGENESTDSFIAHQHKPFKNALNSSQQNRHENEAQDSKIAMGMASQADWDMGAFMDMYPEAVEASRQQILKPNALDPPTRQSGGSEVDDRSPVVESSQLSPTTTLDAASPLAENSLELTMSASGSQNTLSQPRPSGMIKPKSTSHQHNKTEHTADLNSSQSSVDELNEPEEGIMATARSTYPLTNSGTDSFLVKKDIDDEEDDINDAVRYPIRSTLSPRSGISYSSEDAITRPVQTMLSSDDEEDNADDSYLSPSSIGSLDDGYRRSTTNKKSSDEVEILGGMSDEEGLVSTGRPSLVSSDSLISPLGTFSTGEFRDQLDEVSAELCAQKQSALVAGPIMAVSPISVSDASRSTSLDDNELGHGLDSDNEEELKDSKRTQKVMLRSPSPHSTTSALNDAKATAFQDMGDSSMHDDSAEMWFFGQPRRAQEANSVVLTLENLKVKTTLADELTSPPGPRTQVHLEAQFLGSGPVARLPPRAGSGIEQAPTLRLDETLTFLQSPRVNELRELSRAREVVFRLSLADAGEEDSSERGSGMMSIAQGRLALSNEGAPTAQQLSVDLVGTHAPIVLATLYLRARFPQRN
mmetsp:Transcript_1709/g.4019  ORF Transcript_1709/g.4019 Transcript_1709/m.4019 type:complete len:1347 (+) Transcript_1709:151-4191(+)